MSKNDRDDLDASYLHPKLDSPWLSGSLFLESASIFVLNSFLMDFKSLKPLLSVIVLRLRPKECTIKCEEKAAKGLKA